MISSSADALTVRLLIQPDGANPCTHYPTHRFMQRRLSSYMSNMVLDPGETAVNKTEKSLFPQEAYLHSSVGERELTN